MWRTACNATMQSYPSSQPGSGRESACTAAAMHLHCLSGSFWRAILRRSSSGSINVKRIEGYAASRACPERPVPAPRSATRISFSGGKA
eukprot:Skav234213  [mRNA]  locus=scaffold2795:187833:188733:+ [translate_table: standard]